MKNEQKYIKIKALKNGMSQSFDAVSSAVLPFTSLKLCNSEDFAHFENYGYKKPIVLIGLSKGKGFQGVMKRWNFSGMPKSHGTKTNHRAPGSIGAQGQGRVIPGKKMAGRMGGDKITIKTKFLGFDKEDMTIQVKGAVPGSRATEIMVYLEKDQDVTIV